MLVHLHVKNLALIEEIEVEFGPGLNILTGETGAGKSILLGSIQLILGGKISRDRIRDNAPYALVELLFQVENRKAEEALRAMDLETEDGQILLSRKITGNRSICRINGETCTIQQMKEAAAHLLDIHGQHEHQSLLYQEKQLEILDAYGKESVDPVRQKVREAFQTYQRCRDYRKSLDIDEEQRKREMAFLEFEIREIESAALKEGEDEELEQFYRKLSHSRQIHESLQEAHLLTGYESGQGAGESVGRALREISRVLPYDPQLQPLSDSLTDIDALLSDFNRELSSYMDGLVFDEEAFYETEQRLDLLNTLKARYGKTIPDIQSYAQKQKSRLEKLMRLEENLAEAERRVRAAEALLKRCSAELSEIRKEYSRQLEQKIIEGLRDLNFADVRFAIEFQKKESYTANGWDEILYMISTNPGEPLRPLGKIVSGGELSRIMLAIKTILADRDEIETLIFDEIDTGISGRTAQKVSEKMAAIGAHHQVLCITHLPQIAAMADVHFEIRKTVRESGTTTQIYPLDEVHSVTELARLLGGAEITAAVDENAREMKKLALRYKENRM